MSDRHDSSFVDLFIRHQRRIYGYILTVVPDRNDADDLFQQTSLILLQKEAEFRPDGDFTRWACGIAYNVIRNYRSKERHDRHLFSDDMIEYIATARSEKSDWLESALTVLGQCVNALLETERYVLDIFYGGKQTILEIAQQLGITENAVYQRLYRIRAKLLKCIQQTMDQ